MCLRNVNLKEIDLHFACQLSNANAGMEISMQMKMEIRLFANISTTKANKKKAV
jgi:hypothetical protein